MRRSRPRRGGLVGLVTLLAGLALVRMAGAEPRVVDMPLRDGRLPEDRRLVRVTQGDDVTLRWSSDRPLTVHLHGYDLEVKVVPGPAVPTRFAARATGRFVIEVHGARGDEPVVGYLEVHPR